MANSAGNATTLLSQEWQTLHQDHERYDRYGLLIKLTAVVVSLLALALGMTLLLTLIFVLILWLQEGIWRTIQARTSDRLLEIERLLALPGEHVGLQFYSAWQATRPGTVGLLKEYLRNSLRPTVAYPYVILLALEILAALFYF